jgi:hypothetical protein
MFAHDLYSEKGNEVKKIHTRMLKKEALQKTYFFQIEFYAISVFD